jgi:hypothetical protein
MKISLSRSPWFRGRVDLRGGWPDEHGVSGDALDDVHGYESMVPSEPEEAAIADLQETHATDVRIDDEVIHVADLGGTRILDLEPTDVLAREDAGLDGPFEHDEVESAWGPRAERQDDAVAAPCVDLRAVTSTMGTRPTIPCGCDSRHRRAARSIPGTSTIEESPGAPRRVGIGQAGVIGRHRAGSRATATPGAIMRVSPQCAHANATRWRSYERQID